MGTSDRKKAMLSNDSYFFYREGKEIYFSRYTSSIKPFK